MAKKKPNPEAMVQEAIGITSSIGGLARIEDDDQEQMVATALTSGVNPMLAKADETFDPIVSAAAETLKVARGQKAAVVRPLEAFKNRCRRMLGDYSDRKEKARARLMRRSVARVDDNRSPVPLPVSVTQPTKPVGISTTKVWKYEVTDPSKVNPAFLKPDIAKIGRTVRAAGVDAQSVVGQGVRIWRETQVSSGKT